MGRRLRLQTLAIAVAVAACCAGATPARARSTLGQPASPALIERENIDVAPDGAGLPAGSGDAIHGRATFAATCARCHGATVSLNPERWAYATSLFDYIRRAMPPRARTNLTPDELYGVVAYLLSTNSLISEHAPINASSLPKVRMPRVKDFLGAR
jgi:mono/diheme cytochrome c family protein